MLIPIGFFGAGAAAGAYELISTTVLGSATSSITFDTTGLGSTYKHLQLRITSRGTNSASNTSFMLRFNGDTGNNYRPHYLATDGSSVYSGAGSAQAYGYIGQAASGTTTSNAFSGVVLDILDFANTSKNKTTRNIHGLASNYNSVMLQSNLWMNTAAITLVQVFYISGNMDTNSRASLYGIKG